MGFYLNKTFYVFINKFVVTVVPRKMSGIRRFSTSVARKLMTSTPRLNSLSSSEAAEQSRVMRANVIWWVGGVAVGAYYYNKILNSQVEVEELWVNRQPLSERERDPNMEDIYCDKKHILKFSQWLGM